MLEGIIKQCKQLFAAIGKAKAPPAKATVSRMEIVENPQKEAEPVSKEEFLHDCLVVLPELYEKSRANPKYDLYSKMQKYADKYNMHPADMLLIAEGKITFQGVLVFANIRFKTDFSEKVDLSDYLTMDVMNPNRRLFGEIKLPEGLKEIPTGALYKCYNISSVIIPDSVETIENLAFCDCRNLSKVKISDISHLCRIGQEAFYGCRKLRDINVPEDAEIYDSTFSHTEYENMVCYGKIPCSVKHFRLLTEVGKRQVSATYPTKRPPEIRDYLIANLDSIVEDIVIVGKQDKVDDIIADEVPGIFVKWLKSIFDEAADENNIDRLMQIIIDGTEKTKNYELRLEMMNYQQQRGLFPKQMNFEL